MHTIAMLVILAVILVVTGSRPDDFDRGYQAGQQGRHEAAINYYTKALREGDLSRENRARALNNRAIAYALAGRTDRALVDLDSAVMVEPGDLVIARNRTAVVNRRDPTERGPAERATAALQPQERVRLFGLL
ncbi:MAG: hypothetical protein ACK4QW_08160 [Alphaproteobacteria bacterium]